MGKERFLRELGLSPEVVEPREARSEVIGVNSETEDKKPHPLAEKNSDVLEAKLEAPQLKVQVLEGTHQLNGEATNTEESPDYPAEQPPAKEPATKPSEQPEVEERQATPARIAEIKTQAEVEELAEAVEGAGQEGGAEGNLRESVADEAAPDSVRIPGGKVADEIEPGRATLAATTILPLSLLGTKKAWVWIVVLFCVAIAGYFLLKWYTGKGESISPQKEEPQTVEEFMRDF